MKRTACVLVALIFLLSLCACAAPQPTPAPPEGSAEEPTSTMRLKIAAVYDTNVLGVGTGDRAKPGELYFVPGTIAFDGTPLAAGMVVDVFYDGIVQETYPATVANPLRVAPASTEPDLIGFYLGVLKEYYETDPALNDGITALAFDLTETANLTESEKAALEYLMGCEYGLETVSGAYEELCEQGYIDKKEMYFPEGLLFTIDDVTIKSDNAFTFSIAKWRSGLGAVGANDNEAKLKGGIWSHTPGGMWLS